MEKNSLLRINRHKVRKYWNKSDSEVENIIKDIKDWIQTQDFPEMPTDHMVEFFLTNCKYNLENTKANMETYYSIRQKVPEIYEHSNPKLPEMQDACEINGCYVALPNAIEDLYRITITTLNSDASKFDIVKYYANVMNVYEVRICEDLVVSEICVIDYENLRWGHIYRFSPFILKKIMYIMKNVAKNRILNMHIIRSPTYVNLLIKICKAFMSRKLGDRIQVHSSIDTLYDYIPQDALPSDYGGKERPLNELVDLWKKKVEEYQDRFDMWDRVTREKLVK